MVPKSSVVKACSGPPLIRLWVRRPHGSSSPVGLPGSGRHPGSLKGFRRSRGRPGGGPRRLHSPRGYPGSVERKLRQWGARGSSSGPLHRCVHADSLGPGRHERTFGCVPEVSALGLCCSLPWEGHLPGRPEHVKSRLWCEVPSLERCARTLFLGCRSQQGTSGSEKPFWLRPEWGTGPSKHRFAGASERAFRVDRPLRRGIR